MVMQRITSLFLPDLELSGRRDLAKSDPTHILFSIVLSYSNVKQNYRIVSKAWLLTSASLRETRH